MLFALTLKFNLGPEEINLVNRDTYQNVENKYCGVVGLWIIFVGVCLFFMSCFFCVSLLGLLSQSHKLGGSNDRNLLPHSCGGQKSKIQVSAECVPSEGCEGESAPGLSPLLIVGHLHIHVAFFLNVYLSLNVPFL